MKVIVSTSIEDIFSNFVVVRSFKEARDLKGITTLIIHSFIESEFDAGVFISDLHKQGITQFVYINSNPSVTLKMVLNGVNGHFYEDEFYLEDEEELICLLEELGLEGDSSSTELVTTSSIKIISDFIQAFARGEERVNIPMYLEQVNQAIDELNTVTQRQELQLTAMGNSALEVFEKASTIIKSMVTKNQEIERQLAELSNSQSNSSSMRPSFSNSITFFQPYKYIGTSKILLIRELTPCRYLTSFLLGYLHHLHYEKNKRVKLVFIHQKGAGVSQIYNDFTNITQETMNMTSLYDAEVVATNNPKKEVMKELLSKPNDINVVVDRLYGKEDIVTGRVIKLNAVSGKNDCKRFKINPNDCIFSVTSQPVQFCCLPTIKKFPDELDARYAVYAQVCGDIYKKLDDKLNLL